MELETDENDALYVTGDSKNGGTSGRRGVMIWVMKKDGEQRRKFRHDDQTKQKSPVGATS